VAAITGRRKRDEAAAKALVRLLTEDQSPESRAALTAIAFREHNFNPDEPRDLWGQWTTVGSSDDVTTPVIWPFDRDSKAKVRPGVEWVDSTDEYRFSRINVAGAHQVCPTPPVGSGLNWTDVQKLQNDAFRKWAQGRSPTITRTNNEDPPEGTRRGKVRTTTQPPKNSTPPGTRSQLEQSSTKTGGAVAGAYSHRLSAARKIAPSQAGSVTFQPGEATRTTKGQHGPCLEK